MPFGLSFGVCVCVCMDDGGDQFQIIIIILYWDFELDIFPLILRQLLSFFFSFVLFQSLCLLLLSTVGSTCKLVYLITNNSISLCLNSWVGSHRSNLRIDVFLFSSTVRVCVCINTDEM